MGNPKTHNTDTVGGISETNTVHQPSGVQDQHKHHPTQFVSQHRSPTIWCERSTQVSSNTICKPTPFTNHLVYKITTGIIQHNV
jgi:hypothetical protein